jgi:hypothetical protein
MTEPPMVFTIEAFLGALGTRILAGNKPRYSFVSEIPERMKL